MAAKTEDLTKKLIATLNNLLVLYKADGDKSALAKLRQEISLAKEISKMVKRKAKLLQRPTWKSDVE